MGYTTNYSHLIGIMISKTIGIMGYTIFRQTQISDSETFKRQSPILRTETSPETSQNSRRLRCWSCACGCRRCGCPRGSRRCGCPRCHSSLSSRSGTKLGDCSARFLSISSTHSFQIILTLRFKEFKVQQDTDEIFISKFAASQAFCSFWTMAAWLRLCMVLLESSILTPASLMTRMEPGIQEIKRKWIGLMNVGSIWLYLKIGDHHFWWFSITFPYLKLPCYQNYIKFGGLHQVCSDTAIWPVHLTIFSAMAASENIP